MSAGRYPRAVKSEIRKVAPEAVVKVDLAGLKAH